MNDPNQASGIDALLRLWEGHRKRGEKVRPEDLAKDCPELLPELKRQIEAIDGLGRFLQVRAARTDSADASQINELRELLRRRLIAIAGLCLAYGVVDWGFMYWSSRASGAPTLMMEYLVSCTAVAAIMAFLCLRRGLSLPALRGIELALFGLVMAALLWGEYNWLGSGWAGQLAGAAQPAKISALMGDSLGAPWFVLIVLYGACIPNSGRRCAAVVSTIAAVALVAILVFCRREEHEGLRAEIVGSRIAFWLGLGAAMAIYGSHRLSALRGEVHEARKLGQYVLKRFLGAGGMGEVFLAEHQLLRR